LLTNFWLGLRKVSTMGTNLSVHIQEVGSEGEVARTHASRQIGQPRRVGLKRRGRDQMWGVKKTGQHVANSVTPSSKINRKPIKNQRKRYLAADERGKGCAVGRNCRSNKRAAPTSTAVTKQRSQRQKEAPMGWRAIRPAAKQGVKSFSKFWSQEVRNT